MSPLLSPTMRLANHVRACQVGGHVILLDLQRSKYIGIGGAQAASLATAIAGWPSLQPSKELPAETSAADSTVRRLLEERLLTELAPSMEAQPVLPIPPVLPAATASLSADEGDHPPTFRVGHLLRLWRSTAIASSWLRRLSMAEIAARVDALKVRHERKPAPSEDALRQSVAAYLRLRPFVFTSHDRCLNDSLALLLFLASDRLFPRWVVGVHTHPFAAHSWVQQGPVVVNDYHERVRRFAPILVV